MSPEFRTPRFLARSYAIGRNLDFRRAQTERGIRRYPASCRNSTSQRIHRSGVGAAQMSADVRAWPRIVFSAHSGIADAASPPLRSYSPSHPMYLIAGCEFDILNQGSKARIPPPIGEPKRGASSCGGAGNTHVGTDPVDPYVDGNRVIPLQIKATARQ